jgi:opacity protein-like surface antigen
MQMNTHITVKTILAAALMLLVAATVQAADSSNPTFIEAGKAYLITLPAPSDGNPNKIIEIICAAGGGWYRVISYSVRRGTNMHEKSALPTEMWINFAQVVTATEAITHDKTK